MAVTEIFEHDFYSIPNIKLGNYENANPNKFLGSFLDWNKTNNAYEQRSNYFIGACWIEVNESVLIIKPKIKRLNYLKIFLECLSNSIVTKHFNDTYKIFFDQPLIEISSKSFDITPLLIAHFLSVVKAISKKGLKKGYVDIIENLSGKIKGKINVQQNIRKNLSANRADRNVCHYQTHTQNCLENRLIKTALLQVGRYVNRYNLGANLNKLLKYNSVAFDAINEIKVSFNDFKKIKHSSFYAEYKEALKLAEMIFRRLGFNPQQTGINTKTPPFYINMPELFERYVEVKLREKYSDLKAGYGYEGYSETRSKTWKLRPDFLLPSLKMIIDAKYKRWFGFNNNDYLKNDYQQLSLYGRTKDILSKINSETLVPKLVFIYPLDSDNAINLDLNLTESEEDFEQIYKIGISFPRT